jgi:hypothetical protein
MVPFEDRSRPFFDRLLATIRMAFAEPRTLFASLPEGDIGAPFVYGVIVTTVAVAAGCFYSTLTDAGMLSMMPERARGALALDAISNVAVIVVSPVLAAVYLFVGTAVYHVMLMLLGAANRSFATTFRVVAYASTPGLLAVVPICGGLVGGVWEIVLAILGAAIAHRTSGWRAAIAYFLPLLVCCCLPLVALIAAGGAALLNELR